MEFALLKLVDLEPILLTLISFLFNTAILAVFRFGQAVAGKLVVTLLLILVLGSKKLASTNMIEIPIAKTALRFILTTAPKSLFHAVFYRRAMPIPI